ncbi:hypothetical protein [Microtetraspora malaysiensis]|uniref:hypothetical protein n=1 Tax=Microtetraspora malaysiensis TaxID=161358 RepID=UPI0012F9FD05|nr:hypothetical protein [Microtetraspora malaysiensis]
MELSQTAQGFDDPAQAADLVQVAHQVCPSSNATRGNIEVVLVVNGIQLWHAAA